MKRFVVTIQYQHGRKNQLVKWADNENEAKRLALKDWGNPIIYKSLIAVIEPY